MAPKKKKADGRIAVQNRKARHNFEILETVEAGIQLQGSEVKSLREGHGSILEAYARGQNDEFFLVNANIPEYRQAGQFNHEPKRMRKLLLHRREINRLQNEIARGGMTIVPLKIYFNDRGKAKVELGIARGKKLYDKRATDKDRDWQRDKARLLRAKG
ncbi:MAG: SsrA-binding protein SmpB [Rhodospirillales bacterium]|nr:SsrA-binding protein SmpB [Rhodospirillales bacterium]